MKTPHVWRTGDHDMESTTNETIYDVIYFEQDLEDCDRIKALLKETFPDAKVEDAHDYIKGYRLTFEDKEDVKEKFWKLLFNEGYTTLSIEMIARTPNHSDQKLLVKIIDEMKENDEYKKKT